MKSAFCSGLLFIQENLQIMINPLYTELFNQLMPHTTILTPNRRLAATLHQHFHTNQLKQGLSCWQTPDILPLTSWLQRLWINYLCSSAHPAPLLLNSSQSAFLWEKLILHSKDNERLLQVSETADIAHSAWKLLLQWQIKLDHPLFMASEDYAALHQWAHSFQQKCQERQWIDESSLPDRLIQLINNKDIIPPKHLMLIGFTETSPQINQLLACCDKKGAKIKQTNLAQQHSHCSRINLENEDKEIETIARWAKSIHTTKPDAAIGCVIPKLDKIRDRVKQIFTDVFVDSAPFNISAGKRLIDYPIIYCALQLLQLNNKTIARETLSHILMSPFIGEAEIERMKRATADNELRKKNINLINLSEDIEQSFKYCRHFTKRILRLNEFFSQLKETLTYIEWANEFSNMLSILGWPGDRSLNSEEYQTVDAWLNLLNEFSSLDYVAAPVSLTHAVFTLKKIAKKNVFQPKTPESPIQVLGVLEAAGSPFDYLWVAGMDDIAWPPQPKPNPFIPKKLQREMHMPHATAERELRFCTTLTQHFQQSAGEVIFSYAEKNEDLTLQASPLIRSMPEIKIEHLQLPSYSTPSVRIYQTKMLESLQDDQGPNVQPHEKVTGGVSILKLQALCPFKAFAEKRLYARALESPLPGLRPKDRGELVHSVLEIIWNQLGDQANLLAKSPDELQDLINNSIAKAILAFQHHALSRIKYMQLEHQRLYTIVWDWLQIEKERPPFKIVNTEKTTEMMLNQLKLAMRVDRIDELADGKWLIIDYKTGKQNNINQWLSSRPEEPQLPLYALEYSQHAVSIAFAELSPGTHCFKGLSQYSLDIKGIKPIAEIKSVASMHWPDVLNEWKNTLTILSDDFYAGNAMVDPKDPPETCQWCELKSLCRINEEGDVGHVS